MKSRSKRENIKSEEIMKFLQEGKELPAMVKKYPGFCLRNKRKAEEWISYFKRRRVEETGPDLDWACADAHLSADDYGDNVDDQQISDWLQGNVKTPRIFKQSQLYLWGVSNLGKTSLLNTLGKFLRIYDVPKNLKFDDYEDGLYDLCYIDEFNGQFTVTFLNEFLQGGRQTLPTRYRQNIKNDNLPVIIMSQKHPREVYPKVDLATFNAFLSRIDVVFVEHFIKVLSFYNDAYNE